MTSSILIVEARFYAHISDMLLDGATAAIEKAGAHFERLSVPGALEIPTSSALMSVSPFPQEKRVGRKTGAEGRHDAPLAR